MESLMEEKHETISKWIKLDNAATIYPATLSKKYAHMFRMSAQLRDTVDKEILSFIEQYGERAMFEKYFYYDKYEKMYCVRDDAIRQKSMTISYYYTMRSMIILGR